MEGIGIMGGTFDPIHTGHLLTAEFVRDAYGLEKVLFIPAAHSPFKLDKRVASAEDRLAMTELAVAGNPHFEASDIEMCREGVSYTSDTIAALHEYFGPEVPLYFITGADAINDLPDWHQPWELLASCHFIAARRQGTALDMAKLRGFSAASAMRTSMSSQRRNWRSPRHRYAGASERAAPSATWCRNP